MPNGEQIYEAYMATLKSALCLPTDNLSSAEIAALFEQSRVIQQAVGESLFIDNVALQKATGYYDHLQSLLQFDYSAFDSEEQVEEQLSDTDEPPVYVLPMEFRDDIDEEPEESVLDIVPEGCIPVQDDYSTDFSKGPLDISDDTLADITDAEWDSWEDWGTDDLSSPMVEESAESEDNQVSFNIMGMSYSLPEADDDEGEVFEDFDMPEDSEEEVFEDFDMSEDSEDSEDSEEEVFEDFDMSEDSEEEVFEDFGMSVNTDTADDFTMTEDNVFEGFGDFSDSLSEVSMGEVANSFEDTETTEESDNSDFNLFSDMQGSFSDIAGEFSIEEQSAISDDVQSDFSVGAENELHNGYSDETSLVPMTSSTYSEVPTPIEKTSDAVLADSIVGIAGILTGGTKKGIKVGKQMLRKAAKAAVTAVSIEERELPQEEEPTVIVTQKHTEMEG